MPAMKFGILLKRLLGISAVTKSRCGFLIAFVSIATIGGREAMTNIGFFNRNEAYVCIIVAALGFLFWLTGWSRGIGTPEAMAAPVQDEFSSEGAEPQPGEHPMAFLTSLKYWGLILLLVSGLLTCFVTLSHRQIPTVVRARVMTVTITNLVTITNVAPEVVWPNLRLQGVVVNGERSSAMLNGRVLCLGEALSNVVLVAVSAEEATVALGGKTRVLPLRK